MCSRKSRQMEEREERARERREREKPGCRPVLDWKTRKGIEALARKANRRTS
jgi:hypothetical protein